MYFRSFYSATKICSCILYYQCCWTFTVKPPIKDVPKEDNPPNKLKDKLKILMHTPLYKKKIITSERGQRTGQLVPKKVSLLNHADITNFKSDWSM